MESSAQRDYVRNKWKHDITIETLATGVDPASATAGIFTSTVIGRGSFNMAGYNNSRIDQLFKLDISEPDIKKKKYYKELNDILSKDLPAISIWVGLTHLVTIRELDGLEMCLSLFV